MAFTFINICKEKQKCMLEFIFPKYLLVWYMCTQWQYSKPQSLPSSLLCFIYTTDFYSTVCKFLQSLCRTVSTVHMTLIFICILKHTPTWKDSAYVHKCIYVFIFPSNNFSFLNACYLYEFNTKDRASQPLDSLKWIYTFYFYVHENLLKVLHIGFM